MNPRFMNKEKAIQIIKTGFLPGENIEFSLIGHSMDPFIHPGARLILSTQINPSRIIIGDIIAIIHQDSIIAHRVIFIIKKKGRPFLFLTKGDGNRTFDKPIYPDQILGKIVAIRKEKRLINLCRPFWRITGFWIVAGSGVFGILYKWINCYLSSGKIMVKISHWLNKLLLFLQHIFLHNNDRTPDPLDSDLIPNHKPDVKGRSPFLPDRATLSE